MAKCTEGLDLERIVSQIEEGLTLRKIAKSYSLDIAQLRRWIDADVSRSHACAHAREESAFEFAQKAEDVLKDESVDTPRARELAAHYRWEAKMRKRGTFGDQVNIESKVTIADLSESQVDDRITRLHAALAEAGIPTAPRSEATLH